MLNAHVHLDHILPEEKRWIFYELMDVYGLAKLDDVFTFWSAEYESDNPGLVREQVVALVCKLAAVAQITFKGVVVVGNSKAKAFRSNPAAKFFITKLPRGGDIGRAKELVMRLRSRRRAA